VSRRLSRRAVFKVAAALSAPAVTVLAADDALARYEDVMARKGDLKKVSDDQWNLVEEWTEQEEAALYGLADETPGGLKALLRRVVTIGDRLDGDTSWNLMDAEAALIRSMRRQAQELLRQI